MGAIRLQKIGNSLGFRLPKGELEKAGFDISSDYEVIAERGVITLVKRRPHHSEWTFPQADISGEDREWLEADLGEDGETR